MATEFIPLPSTSQDDVALLTAENRILHLIATDQPASEVLSEIARSAESLCGDGILCSVLLLDETRTKLLHGAAPSLPEDYNRQIHGITIGPTVGSCGTAAFTGKQVIVSDIAKDPLWADFKDLALAHGLRACWSTPIVGDDGKLLGTFALYYNRASYPTKFATRVIDSLTRIAAIAIEHCTSGGVPKPRKHATKRKSA
jgi:GAF domain-containing protein